MSEHSWERVRELIGAGEQVEALSICISTLAGIAPDLHRQALLLSSRLSHVSKQEREGLAPDVFTSVERNRVSKSLLELVDKAERLGGLASPHSPAASHLLPTPKNVPTRPQSTVTSGREQRPRLFFSYCREDWDRVVPIADKLRAAGLVPQLDETNITIGAEWARLIQTMISACDYFVLCQTKRLTDRVFSYVHQEIDWALDKQARARPGALYILPLQLDAGPPMERLSHLQHRAMESDHDVDALINSIREDFSRR